MFLLDWIKLPAAVSRLENRVQGLERQMGTFEDELAELDKLTNEWAGRMEEYERVNAKLRTAVEQGDQTKAAALAAQSASYAESIAVINERLRGTGANGTALPEDTEPLPPTREPLL